MAKSMTEVVEEAKRIGQRIQPRARTPIFQMPTWDPAPEIKYSDPSGVELTFIEGWFGGENIEWERRYFSARHAPGPRMLQTVLCKLKDGETYTMSYPAPGVPEEFWERDKAHIPLLHRRSQYPDPEPVPTPSPRTTPGSFSIFTPDVDDRFDVFITSQQVVSSGLSVMALLAKLHPRLAWEKPDEVIQPFNQDAYLLRYRVPEDWWKEL